MSSIDKIKYDPETGVLTGVNGSNGNLTRIGYLHIQAEGRKRGVHQVVWRIVTGKWAPKDMVVDHKDGDKTNNRFSNLQLITQQHNICREHGARKPSFDKKSNKWRVQTFVNGKNVHVGYYSDKSEADAVAALFYYTTY